MGKAKVAPASGHTIPRLELCAAVLAVQISEIVKDNLEIKFHDINYYSDSRIVLGYLYNTSRRFMTYVSNHVEKVRKISHPDQWNYVSTQLNPADIGTRGTHVDKIQDSLWLVGPSFLLQRLELNSKECSKFPLVNLEEDAEIKKEMNTLITVIRKQQLDSERFSRFSSWKKLVMACTFLMHRASSVRRKQECLSQTVERRRLAEMLILRETQKDSYPE
ncbi:uncharacterized protein LOC121386134 [Gigantopelta aegis]|uniref:uncharacterized protein LOC121386134 n=1 Tax=Gigantopelta aegis TaxID=1735272 RepID=UPI001B88DDBC|nr:uncharacterized protein LOC121386134 [Gigantopelta aegis]